MPPLPQNGTCYPPSSSGYQPLSRTSEEDLESRPSSFSSSSFRGRIKQRSYAVSPSSSAANDPTDILRSFLADTRSNTYPRKLSLRISVSNETAREKVVVIPLLELTERDSLPYAVADDVPCLRGLPAAGPSTAGERFKGFIELLTNRNGSSSGALDIGNSGKMGGLQVYNTSQKQTLYATPEEIERYHHLQSQAKLPPWTPLNSTTPQPQQDEPEEEQEPDANSGDFDLGSVFKRTRKRKTTRLVSVGLQEAFERFSDDRHFSKTLVCRRNVWGWDFSRLRASILDLIMEANAASAGKGKGRAIDTEGLDVKIEVAGLKDGPAYQVVWAPMPFLSRRCGWAFESHGSVLAISLLSGLFVGSALLGLLTNTLMLIAGVLVLVGWGGMMYLIRTQGRCVYDTVGTAFSLAPRWVKLADVDSTSSYDQVSSSLRARYGDKTLKIEQRGEEKAWFVQRGVDQDEWLQSHRQQILHLIAQ